MKVTINSMKVLIDEEEILQMIRNSGDSGAYLPEDVTKIKKMKVIYDNGKFLSVELEPKKSEGKSAETTTE